MKRRQLITPFVAGLLAAFVLASCTGRPLVSSADLSSNASTPVTTITVSAAASLQDALEVIAPQVSQTHPDIVIEYNFGSSGALQQQIQQGAPVDVFFSAATEQMDKLAKKNILAPESRQDLLTNRLVLIAPKNSPLTITQITQLTATDIRRLAVGEFRSVPAGQYAQQALETLKLLEPLQSKFVFGSNVRSVLTAVESGNAEVGIVYATDAALSHRIKVLATTPEETHLPIVYPIAIIKDTPNPEAAQTFINFLTTEAAQEIFVDFGFGSI
ncbi:MAG: molybdate ABC transporter substrate-binding protein [Cyanobacteria bacterium P01_D01_bin.105]